MTSSAGCSDRSTKEFDHDSGFLQNVQHEIIKEKKVLQDAFRLTENSKIYSISSMNDLFGRQRSLQTDAILPTSDDIDLAALAKAIAHPGRVRILKILASRKSCVCGDIVHQLPLAQSTVSEHLRILKTAGLILGEIDGPRVCYCIHAETLERLKCLIQELPNLEQPSASEPCKEPL